MVDSLREFLDDLLNYPLVEDWRKSLARFREHWIERGLILTPRTMAFIEQRIEARIGRSVAVMLAEGPAAAAGVSAVATDAVLPMAAPSHAAPRAYEAAAPDRGLLGYQFVAIRLGREEQRLLGLSDEERREYERYVVESLRAQAKGELPPPPPRAWYEKKGAWLARQAGLPSMRGVTPEEQDRSILRWKYEHLAELPADEQARLRSLALMEQRRQYAEKYGLLAAFLNPAFDGTGTLNDWAAVTGGFAATPPPGLDFRSRPSPPLASPARGKGSAGQRGEKPFKKPAFPPPESKERLTIRRGKKTPHPSHVKSAASEEQAARSIHKLPAEVVIYWGIKSGTHGADVISYNLQTKTVTLWDVKWRGQPRRIQSSTTFRKGSDPLAKALKQAIDAIHKSRLSKVHKNAALESIVNKTFNTRTLGDGRAKNSTFGDHQ